jgi:predicted dehydrogenase
MSLIKFGIIGTGGMARGHAKRINENKETEVTALCDVSEDIVLKFKEAALSDCKNELQIFTDTKQMFKDANLDAVLIASPHTLHFEHGMQALEAGCHIYMEKPMVTDTKQAYTLKEKAEEVGKIVIIGYNTPCSPVFETIKNTINNGDLGKLELVNGFLSQNWMNATKGTWRQKPELSGGGQAYDSGAHILNSLVWSVGSSPKRVSAFIDNHGTDVDINSVISVQFENNVMANITISGNCPEAGAFMTFIFDNGRIDVDGWTANWIKAFQNGEEIDIVPKKAKQTGPLKNLIDAILGREEPRTTPQNGIYQSELMDAIYLSAQKNEIIQL